jgi:hypothetical protein
MEIGGALSAPKAAPAPEPAPAPAPAPEPSPALTPDAASAQTQRTDANGVVRIYEDDVLIERRTPDNIVAFYRGDAGRERIAYEKFPDNSFRVYERALLDSR